MGREKIIGPRIPVPAKLFGLHIHRAGTTTPWPAVSFGAWRLWDAYAGWPWIQPSRGDWRFATLDRLVGLAESHGVRVLLPLGLSPEWASSRPEEASSYRPGFAAEPADVRDWKRYVGLVARRYRGRVREYEIWNEPDRKGFFSGGVANMVELAREAYEVVKEVDPEALVVSPSPTGAETGPDWLSNYLASGGARYADVIGYHFYVAPSEPEAMLPLIREIREIMTANGAAGKPLWNTETGWIVDAPDNLVRPAGAGLHSRLVPQAEMAAYVCRSYLISWAAGVERFYWYSWDHAAMGLADASGKTLRSAASAYSTTFDWMVGAQLSHLEVDDAGTWRCELNREDNSTSWVLWNPDAAVSFELPATWIKARAVDLRGASVTMEDPRKVRVTSSPIRVERLVQDHGRGK